MKSIWLIILGALLVFGIIYGMNGVADKPMPGLTADGEVVDVVKPTESRPSESKFEPLDLSSNNKSIFIKSANADTAENERTAARTIGNQDAEVKMFVLSSLTCSHCAELHTKTLKEIEKKYVETGKVFFTYVDFPFDKRALAGATVARCVPPENYFTFLNVLFENQKSWAFKPNAQDIVTEYAALQGMPRGSVRACLGDKDLQQAIIKHRDEFAKKYKISSTPTTLILKGGQVEVVVGNDKDKLESAIEKMLK